MAAIQKIHCSQVLPRIQFPSRSAPSTAIERKSELPPDRMGGCLRKRCRFPWSRDQSACAEMSAGVMPAIHKTMGEGGAKENASSAAGSELDPETSGRGEPREAAEMVKTVTCLAEFNSELASASEKLVVVDFSATWCGPCKMIKPFYRSLSEKYSDVVFLEVDVDEAQDVASHYDVKCMPTFQFFKNNEKVHEFSGANKEKLEETIKKLK
ncbi:thioredoxin domain-containing protein 2-like isoform X2 [Hemicordylus capensis]|uniref:thioredoxin domain-containing protein 2-like isoform X2 n=1 Tax=Hemicordylus capensis TaxID=884348 RepID=UPI0023036399|nr:thioredoxin domain-containing protein 2-like isoform X2 [Hemicordylus capensis]